MGTMEQNTITLTILAMGAVTFLPRLLPLLFLTRRKASGSGMPPLVESWLRHVPVAVLAAMFLPSIVMPEGQVELAPGSLYLWAAVPTLLIAWKTRSLVGSVLAGVATVAVGRLLLG
jgi:branched-subunit amino acid transport protein